MDHSYRIVRNLVAASSLLLAAPLAVAGTITASAHDFSTQSWGQAQICKACHIPHNANSGTSAVLSPVLWNHTLSVATYTLYDTAWSSTLNATAGQPGGTSKLCLSCHDGTVAVDSFGGSTPVPTSIVASANLGTDLRNDHPIGITYDGTLVTADGALRPTSTAVTIGTGGTKTRVGTIANNMLFADRLECASCHDVHNTFTVPVAYAGASSNKLLKVVLTGSSLCLTCHDK